MAIKPLQSITLKNEGGEDTTYVVASAPAIVETTEPADVASFSDGAEGIPVTSLIADISPVQNLNGQSAPYPAGGGKNKLPSPTSTTKTSNGITISVANGVYSINGTASATSEIIFDLPTDVAIDDTMKCAFLNDFANSNVVVYWRYNNTNGSSQGMNSTNYVKEYTESNTFNKVRFLITSGTAISGTVHLSPVLIPKSETNPTAYIPYSNICPITGWTGMNIYRTGKNLLAQSKYRTNASGNTTHNITENFALPKEGQTIRVSATASDGTAVTTSNCAINFFKNTSSVFAISPTQTKTVPDLTGVTKIEIFTTSALADKELSIQIEYGSATTFEEYIGTTYPISWADEAGTVYGGTLDVTTGLLTVTHYYWTENGTANWSKNADGSFFTRYSSPLSTQAAGSVGWCNYCPYLLTFDGVTMFARANNLMNLGKGWGDLYADTTALKAAFAATPLKVVYPLATPQTYQLTPQAVTTILGQNNIWADTGDVKVSYVADTKLYIDKVLTE